MKPSDYPLGSGRSRAAARLLLEQRRTDRSWITLINDLGVIEEPRFSQWIEDENGNFYRVASIPAAMSTEEAERIFEENKLQRL